MRSRVLLFALPLLLAFAEPAFARGGGTLDSILPEIRAQHPGRLSDAEPFTASDGSTHYRIKWMTPDGRILYFDADTHSGRYFSADGDPGGSQWRRDHGDDEGGHSWHDGDDRNGGDDNGDRHRRDWNGANPWTGGSNPWNGSGDWTGGDDHGGGDWHGGQGTWRGNRGGDWRGGHMGGDNGGPYQHHGG